MMPLRLLTFSTLYPNDAAPAHGIFVEARLRHLIQHQPVESTVLAPVPFFPFSSPLFGAWSRHARAPRREERFGLTVHHPRYLAIPRVGMSAAPLLLYRTAARALRRLLASGLRFDAIDAHYLYPDGVAATWLGHRFGLPTVVTVRGSDVTAYPDHAVPRWLIRRAIAGADALIAVSEALKTRLVALGAEPARVTVLRNGVDPVLFHPLPRPAARAALGLTRPALVSVGHLIERKGHHRVIAAMTELPELDLLVVGEGPEKARLSALAARLGLAGRVRFVGAVPQADLPLYYSAAEAMVLASSREGWANVLLEAMACGTPVVASNVWGNPEVVQSRDAGLVVPANTPEAIAAGVKDLLAAPPSRAATRAYAERFGWEATSAGQMAVFAAVLHKHCPTGPPSRPQAAASMIGPDSPPRRSDEVIRQYGTRHHPANDTNGAALAPFPEPTSRARPPEPATALLASDSERSDARS